MGGIGELEQAIKLGVKPTMQAKQDSQKKTLIAIPCMSTVYTRFMIALLNMRKPGMTQIAITESSLIHNARHVLARQAIDGNFDRILWLDSDMAVPVDLMERLSANMDKGLEFVTALYFKRTIPAEPVIYKSITFDGTAGASVTYRTYPRESLFEVAGCGLGACMMDVSMLARFIETGAQYPFEPLPNLGEDLSFCMRLNGVSKIHCDSQIRVPHIGLYEYRELDYEWDGMC